MQDDEETESLVNKLAQFYADRTLTRSPITPADQAEAYFLLVTDRLSKTTGQVITVDGGLHEAFYARLLNQYVTLLSFRRSQGAKQAVAAALRTSLRHSGQNRNPKGVSVTCVGF